MNRIFAIWAQLIDWLSSRWVESAALLMTRLALAGVFWRSGRTKVDPDSWFSISETTYFLFAEDYAAVPLPSAFAAVAATAAEHVFPILLLLGLATRLSAFALLMMTLVIQIFVFPEAWWPVHSLWVALALILIVRGGGWLGLDVLFGRRQQA